MDADFFSVRIDIMPAQSPPSSCNSLNVLLSEMCKKSETRRLTSPSGRMPEKKGRHSCWENASTCRGKDCDSGTPLLIKSWVYLKMIPLFAVDSKVPASLLAKKTLSIICRFPSRLREGLFPAFAVC